VLACVVVNCTPRVQKGCCVIKFVKEEIYIKLENELAPLVLSHLVAE
jgi:hypothetical protein